MTDKRLTETITKAFAALSIALVLLTISVEAQNRDAAATVRSFYEFQRSDSGIFNERGIKAYRRWLSGDLIKLLQNEMRREADYLKKYPTNKPHFGDGLPFEPYNECSDGEKYTANIQRIGAVAVKGERATVEIKFYQPPLCGGDLIDVYKIELIKSRGKWLIADWIYPDAKTLTEDLKRTEY